MEKICYKCKYEKIEEDFNWRDKGKKIRQGICRECKKIIQKKYYVSHRASYIKTTRRSRDARKLESFKKIKAYLLCHPCVDCDNTDIRVLHFDHVRGEKAKDVMKLVHGGWKWEKIVKEISKCDVRCSNCHMIKTWPNRFGSIV